MSWKLFFQIVLLVVVSALILSALKISCFRYKHGPCGDRSQKEMKKDK